MWHVPSAVASEVRSGGIQLAVPRFHDSGHLQRRPFGRYGIHGYRPRWPLVFAGKRLRRRSRRVLPLHVSRNQGRGAAKCKRSHWSTLLHVMNRLVIRELRRRSRVSPRRSTGLDAWCARPASSFVRRPIECQSVLTSVRIQ